jgi:5-deoxy-glucuronate isomerase
VLADTLFRVPVEEGLTVIQRRGERGARELTSRRLVLAPGATARHESADEETILVLQEGAGSIEAGGSRWRLSRRSVFAERASAVYAPPGASLRIAAEERLEAILVSTPAPPGGSCAVVRPADVRAAPRGRGIYLREVHDIFVADPYAKRLMVGETINPPGHWSSFPPHKHDGRDGEPVLEEVYHYRIDPPHGFAHQMIYTADGESVTHAVRDRDAVLLPYGYHPVSAPPGYRVYYLWAIAGAERRLAFYEDPQHRWIHDAEPQAVGL